MAEADTGQHAERRWPEAGVHRIPYWIYTDAEIYAREQARIFKGPSWNYVGLTAEVPEPGSFRRSFIGDIPVVLTRDSDGGLNVFINKCAHRGVQFCQKQRGATNEFICPYHQWTYDLTGKLIGVPFRRGLKRQGGMPASFELDDHHLQRLQVTERNGVVFASFADDLPPLEDYLGESMLGYFDRLFDGRALKVLGYQRQRIPSNWKLMFENIKDPYHASLLHVFLITFGLFRADNPSAVRLDETGRHSALISRKGEQKATSDTAEMGRFKADMKLNDAKLLTPVKEFPGDTTVVMQTIWPNIIFQQQTNTLATRHIVPRGPGAFDLHWTYFGYEDDDEEMTRIRLRQANLMGPAGYVSIDDSEVMEFSQDGISAFPDNEGILEMGGYDTDDVDHIVTESAIRGFYKYYREVMAL
ncbi:MAG: aromatic ring-hydroxylating dioxygenase subunit alpha [Alphaproteobacteria bacterium]|nr:aromatic ring-hydroxylating dioxygenase subunit alpha [Alphaproteobacteria bacterium]